METDRPVAEILVEGELSPFEHETASHSNSLVYSLGARKGGNRVGSGYHAVTSVEVIRRGGLQRGDSTRGIVRERAFEADEVLFGQSMIAAGTRSGWHHHGTRHLYGYVVSGRLRFDFLQTKIESIEVNPGDYFHIPVGLVHRDVNPDRALEAVVVNILLGKGPAVVNAPDPPSE